MWTVEQMIEVRNNPDYLMSTEEYAEREWKNAIKKHVPEFSF